MIYEVGKQKRLSSTNGTEYSTNHDQHYRMRFGITWKLSCLFGRWLAYAETQTNSNSA